MLATKTPIGELSKRVIFIKPVYASGINRPSTNENEVVSWTEEIEVWCKVIKFAGDEVMIAEQLTDKHYIDVEINYRVVGIDWRMVIDSRVYAVVDVPLSDNKRRTHVRGQLLANETWS